MVVVEEEFVNKHTRKIIIKTDAGNILKKDVYCSITKSEAEKGEHILSEEMSGSSVDLYDIEINENTMGLVLCVNNDCKMIDVLIENESFEDLEGFDCR
ncbi:MAG: hypothetical protein F7B60_06950 [Desulfurococcales archaeon]|nr:hypothetical protein [Desulfurococcales archaeon]